jgi:hypothetical protein
VFPSLAPTPQHGPSIADRDFSVQRASQLLCSRFPAPSRGAFRAASPPIMAPFVVGSQTPEARDNTSALEQRIGAATSVIMPLLEFGAIGFVTWVLCYLICFQYLIDPSEDLRQSFNVQPRRSTGIALIVVYAILLLMLLIPWMRLLQVIWTKQDMLPRAEPTTEKEAADSSAMEQYDAYISDYQGVPLFCEKCRVFKPDRAHHCKELGRCVKKMDHYCPWAGGIIAEHTHKFFMQFVFYGALFTAYLWIVVAVFLADRISKVRLLRPRTSYIVANITSDGGETRTVDRGARCGRFLLHLHFYHVLYDRLQPRHQLHISRSDSTRGHIQHCIPNHKNADRPATPTHTTNVLRGRRPQGR